MTLNQPYIRPTLSDKSIEISQTARAKSSRASAVAVCFSHRPSIADCFNAVASTGTTQFNHPLSVFVSSRSDVSLETLRRREGLNSAKNHKRHLLLIGSVSQCLPPKLFELRRTCRGENPKFPALERTKVVQRSEEPTGALKTVQRQPKIGQTLSDESFGIRQTMSAEFTTNRNSETPSRISSQTAPILQTPSVKSSRAPAVAVCFSHRPFVACRFSKRSIAMRRAPAVAVRRFVRQSPTGVGGSRRPVSKPQRKEAHA
jgi:hypothetical protein